MPNALAHFLTWTTYGTWLQGDERGWARRGKGFQEPNSQFEAQSRSLLTEEPCYLSDTQRALVEKTIADHCRIRNWHLHVVNCRTNHVHLIVTVSIDPEVARDQFKAWCTRRLREQEAAEGIVHRRERWWTERGSERSLGDQASLDGAILYVREGQ